MAEAPDSPVQREHVAPIFILADDDRDAVGRMIQWLPRDWYYIPVTEPEMVVKYAREFATTAVFLADRMDSAPQAVPRLLQSLLDEVGKPVVILSELWKPEVADSWKRMGAADCLPHPTRYEERFKLLRSRMQELATMTPDAGFGGEKSKGHP